MSRRYDPSAYDDNFCLKPPFLLWLALLFLSRAVAVPLLFQLGSVAGISSDTTAFVNGLFSVRTVFPSLIAALVLYAAIRRVPSGSRAARWIWAHGRAFLAAAATLDGALSLLEVPLQHVESSAPGGLVAAAFDLYFLVYVLAARRVRDVFAQFPEPAASPARSG